MATFRTKKDVETWLSSFETHAQYDETGNKWYTVFSDEKQNGQWTLMRYPDGTWSRHGKGETYCDEQETLLEDAALRSFVWSNRKAISAAAKQLQQI